MANKLIVDDTQITVLSIDDKDYISLTDMIKAKDGDFFISDWLRNRNTVEFLGVWEQIHNPSFNYGEFAIIKSCYLRPVMSIERYQKMAYLSDVYSRLEAAELQVAKGKTKDAMQSLKKIRDKYNV